jgi:hypothetical protein
MHSLDDIIGIAPAADNTNGALPAEVLAGKTFWSLRTNSAWGLQTGTAAQGNNVDGLEGAKTFAIPDGFYSGKTATANDEDLVANNVKSGVDILGVGGTYPLAPVPRTGVTETLASGDDGDLEKGIVWPNPRFTIHDGDTPGYTNDDTVTDNLTGLMWTRNANHGTKKWYDGNTGSYPALEYCNDLPLGGYDDWRLPNVRELQSLVHHGFIDPAVPNTEGTGRWSDGDPFIGVQSFNYWSSTTGAGSASVAWVVRLSGGAVDDSDRTFANYVWPVRGGQ